MIYYLYNSIFSLELVHSIPSRSCITFRTNLSEIDGHRIDESHTIYYHGWKKIIYLLILFPRLVVLEEDLDKVSPLTVARMYDVCHTQHVLNILWWPKSLIAVVYRISLQSDELACQRVIWTNQEKNHLF